MKNIFRLIPLALLGLISCKEEPAPPSFGTEHKITLGVKVNVAAASNDGLKQAKIDYTGAHGEFTKNRPFKDTVGMPYPLNWDTTFSAYPGGMIRYETFVRGYNLKMYSTDDYKKGDTTFVVASPDKANVIEINVKD